MARKPRFSIPGVPQHVIQRGNNRQPCFFAHADFQLYLNYLADAAERESCQVHAYVLMTNHVHLLVTPCDDHSIAHMMQRLGQRYVRTVNRIHKRTGTLWEGRYRASLVESERYLLTCMRYIELNPVRAGMVEDPSGYRWSSYRANAQNERNDVLTPHELYLRISATASSRCEAYRELFRSHIGQMPVDAIRDALNKELVLGSAVFKRKIEIETSRQAGPRLRGRTPGQNNIKVY